MNVLCMFLAVAVVADGGFERGGEGWLVPKETCRVQSGAGLKGSYALVWENNDPAVYKFPVCPLSLESGRAYTLSGWIKSEGLTNATYVGRLTNLAIEWRDTTGKFRGMFGARNVIDNQEQQEGWTKYAGSTPVMPEDFGSATLVCSTMRGSTGKVVFDDIEVTALAFEPVPCMATSAYRDTAASGKVALAARCVVNPNRDSIEDLSAVFRCVGENGELRLPARIEPDGIVRGEVDVSRLAFGANPVSVEVSRRDGTVFGSRELAFTRVKALPQRKVTFDEHGRTILEGKPFFPLGLYSSRPQVAELDTYCEGPFNCILPYALKPDAAELDPYWKRGLRVIVCASDFTGYRGSKLKGIFDERAYMSRYLHAFKGHPALLAWYIADELDVGHAGSLRERNLQIREADPDHPTYIVLDNPRRPVDFIEGYDIVGMDPYPVGIVKEYRDWLARVSTYPEEAMHWMFGFRPMWQVPQTFNWAWSRPWAVAACGAHMPTRAELRNMNWQAIASGANGRVGWWFAGMIRNLKQKGKTDEFLRVWSDVKAAYGEVAEKIPLLLSVESAPNVVKKPQNISARTWRKDGVLWLLVVNRTYEPVEGKVELSDGQSVDARLEGLGARFLRVGDALADSVVADKHPWSHLNFQDDPQDFRFAIVPDRTGGDYRGAFTNALRCCNLMHPAFVMTVGDLIQGHGDEKCTRAQQGELTNFVSQAKAPFFYAVGNHDIFVNTDAKNPNDRTKHTMSTRVWKDYFGENTYYSFTYKGCLFIVLNGQEGRLDWAHIENDITPEQYGWMRTTLAEHNDVRWTFLFMHQPDIWKSEAWCEFEKGVLLSRKYTVFAGDWHNYFHYRRYDHDYYVLSVAGGCGSHAWRKKEEGSKLYGQEYGEFDHITWVTMTSEGPEVVNLRLDGILPGNFLNATNTKDLYHVRTRQFDIPSRDGK